MTTATTAHSALRRPATMLLGASLVVGVPALSAGPAAASGATTTAVSATAAPSAASTATQRTLRYGSRGADVRQLQRWLGMRPTGYFGPITRKKVRAVQRAAGLRATGIVNASTRAAVIAAYKKRARVAATSSRSARAGSPAAAQRYARSYIAAKYGWGSAQMSCLVAMWNRESGWNYRVSNPNGIYRGIPQTSARVWGAMGYTTAQYMGSPEIQIKVGTSYIKKRYGTPCNAWSFWRSHHWY